MKKILSFLLVAVMLLSIVASTVGATGTLIFSDDFTGFAAKNWIVDKVSCHYELNKDDGYIFGYSDAVVLQSAHELSKNPKIWDQFYAGIDFKIFDYDDPLGQEPRETHEIGIWYRDLFENGDEGKGPVYEFKIEFETKRCFITKTHTWTYVNEGGVTQEASLDQKIIAEAIYEDMEILVSEVPAAPWHELGLRVTEGKIEGYLDGVCVVSAAVDSNDPKLGNFTENSVDATVGSQKSAICIKNGGNYLGLDNFKVITPDYDFGDVTTAVNYGDADGNGKISTLDAICILKAIANWNPKGYVEANADVDGNGKVNTMDVVRLLKYIANPGSVVLGKN